MGCSTATGAGAPTSPCCEAPPSAVTGCGPWQLCQEAVERCRRVRRALGARFNAREDLDAIEEALRQLPTGPTEDSRPALPGPAFDISTRAGRMKKSMHTRWHVRAGKPCTCRP